MKKGCFLKIIIVVTILIAAVLYVFQNHFDDWILSPGEKLIKNLVYKDINEKMEFVQNSPEKDSLKALLNNFVNLKLHDGKKLDFDELQNLADSVSLILNDSLISNNELEKIKFLFYKGRQ